ncbi:unnamed protein product [Ambrosiozyma monospora]|uniref:Ornithine aminotransferase n=1 Tax=Ambrosiozyma monospora TaxID=43982 RepID=A0A9W6Z2L7_AMBMO|nr:unnamed protein product [Ambrosiozyma monospora]
MTIKLSEKAQQQIQLYDDHIVGGFTPYPVPLTKALNAKVWDIDGNEYIDFISFFAVANMGHSHPKIVKASVDAIQNGALINTAFLSPSYGQLGATINKVLGYPKSVCMLSGADATDTAAKIARKWGYSKKNIPKDKAFVLTTSSCYHGITISTHSMASKKDESFGPYLPLVGPVSPSGIEVVFDDLESLEKALEKDHSTIAGFMVETIQGSAGIIDASEGYIKKAYELCQKYNVLFIADEVQTGLGRAGYPLMSVALGAKPDLVCLGKALGGAVAPISAVIGTNDVMSIVDGGDIGSTMAANPPATEAAIAALNVLVDEDICGQSLKKGKILRELIMKEKIPEIDHVSGSGVMAALAFKTDLIDDKFNGRRLAALCAENGLLVIPGGGGKRLRICPPATINEEEIEKGVKILGDCCRKLRSIEGPILGKY